MNVKIKKILMYLIIGIIILSAGSLIFRYISDYTPYNKVIRTIQQKEMTPSQEIKYIKEELKKVENKEDTDANLKFIKGYYYEQLGETSKALSSYKDFIIEINNKNIKNINSYSKIHAQVYVVENLVFENDYMDAVFYSSQMIKLMDSKDYSYYSKELVYAIESAGSIAKNGLEYKISSVESILKEELPIYAKVYFLNYASKLYIEYSDYPKAMEYTIEAIKHSKQIDSLENLAVALGNLALLYKYNGENEIALNIYQEALETKLEDKDLENKKNIDIYLNMAEIEMSRKNIQKAELYFEIVQEKIAQNKKKNSSPQALLNIGKSKVYMYTDLNQAQTYLNKAKENIEALTDIEAEIKIKYWITLGDLEHLKKSYSIAIEHYKIALDKSRKQQNIYFQEQALLAIIKTAKASTNDHNLEVYKEDLLQLLFEQKSKLNESFVGLAFAKQINQRVLEENSSLQEKMIYILIISTLIILGTLQFLTYYRKKGKRDGLTQALNRASLDSNYKSLLLRKQGFAVIIFDLDSFKSLNDTYGHEFGDKVLIKTTKTIKNILGKNAKLYRYGGEEFVVIIKTNDRLKVSLTAEKIRKHIEVIEFENEVKVTISGGLAFSTEFESQTLSKADKRLYLSKKTGKNKITGLEMEGL